MLTHTCSLESTLYGEDQEGMPAHNGGGCIHLGTGSLYGTLLVVPMDGLDAMNK
jgi:hypothetical protein